MPSRGKISPTIIRFDERTTMSSFTTAPGAGGVPGWIRRRGESAAAAATTVQPPMVVGDEIQLTAEHAAGLNATITHTISCLPDYHNRIIEIIGFIRDNYPDLVDSLIIELTPEQRANSWLHHTATHDIFYDHLSPMIMKVFMSRYKKKNPVTGKHYSKEHVWKYHDAILKCDNIAQTTPAHLCVCYEGSSVVD
jgi:hypothetical protein